MFGDDSTVGPPGGSYYSGVDTTSTGFEIESAGRIGDRWKVNGGYSYFTLSDNAGADPRPYIPHRTLKLSSTYLIVPAYDLHVGADMHYQNSIYYIDSGVTTMSGGAGVVRQPSYTTVGLLANARLTDHMHAYLHVNNIADRKYLASLEWGQAYYAAPRNFTLSVSYKF